MGIETIYANILQSILRIAGKYIVSCDSNVIVIQFSNKNVMILFGDQKIFTSKMSTVLLLSYFVS